MAISEARTQRGSRRRRPVCAQAKSATRPPKSAEWLSPASTMVAQKSASAATHGHGRSRVNTSIAQRPSQGSVAMPQR